MPPRKRFSQLTEAGKRSRLYRESLKEKARAQRYRTAIDEGPFNDSKYDDLRAIAIAESRNHTDGIIRSLNLIYAHGYTQITALVDEYIMRFGESSFCHFMADNYFREKEYNDYEGSADLFSQRYDSAGGTIYGKMKQFVQALSDALGYGRVERKKAKSQLTPPSKRRRKRKTTSRRKRR